MKNHRKYEIYNESCQKTTTELATGSHIHLKSKINVKARRSIISNIVAAFPGMHVSPAKHSYA